MAKKSNQATELTDLPNIGSVLADTLRRVGIETPEDLRAAGSVEVLLRIRRRIVDDKACANKLYALEGAIRGIRWHDIPQDERAELWKQYQAQ